MTTLSPPALKPFPISAMPNATLEAVFAQTVADIEAAHYTLDYTLGWRFLYTPQATLTPQPRLLVTLLNPHGEEAKRGNPEYAGKPTVEAGNAYRVEHWSDDGEAYKPLQHRVQTLFQEIAARLGEDWVSLMDGTPTVNFCPFRTPGDSLTLSSAPRNQKDMAVQFAAAIWGRLGGHVQPQVIVALSALAFQQFSRVYETLGYKWGGGDSKIQVKGGRTRVSIRHLSHQASGQTLTLFQVPHPSSPYDNIIGTSNPNRTAAFTETVDRLAECL